MSAPAPAPEPDVASTAAGSDESLGSVLAAMAANATIAVAKGGRRGVYGVAGPAGRDAAHRRRRWERGPALHRDSAQPPAGRRLASLRLRPRALLLGLLAAIGVFVVGGAVSIWDGIHALVHPPALEAFWVGVAVLVIALVLDGLSRTVAVRQLRTQAARRQLSLRPLLRESADPTVVTVYFEDTIDVLGALLALLALVLHRLTGSGLPDALASIAIGALLCYLASALTRRNRALLTNQAVPERYVQRLRDRLETRAEIRAVTRIEAVYLGPTEVLVAADVQLTHGLVGDEVAAVLVRTRADIMRELPLIVRLYLTPVTTDATSST